MPNDEFTNEVVANIPGSALLRRFTKAHLRYCELDTMATVFIWGYFNDMCKTHAGNGDAR